MLNNFLYSLNIEENIFFLFSIQFQLKKKVILAQISQSTAQDLDIFLIMNSLIPINPCLRNKCVLRVIPISLCSPYWQGCDEDKM